MSGVDELPRFLDAGTTLRGADARAAAIVLCGAGLAADEPVTNSETVLGALGVLESLRDARRRQGLRVVRG